LDNNPYGGERNVSRIKDLAERLLDYDYHVETDYDRPRLFLGELPTNLPAQIPGPEGMVLLGGLRRVSPWRGDPDTQVILEAEAERRAFTMPSASIWRARSGARSGGPLRSAGGSSRAAPGGAR
jgi:hypothetical protein